MFEHNIIATKCSVCGEGKMCFCPESTFVAYADPQAFSLEDVEKMVDGVMNEYLVYKCTSCGVIERYTFKDIEKAIRKEISKRVVELAVKKEIAASLSSKNKVLVYCGRCNGFDGKGSCLIKTYKSCKLKRLPDEL